MAEITRQGAEKIQSFVEDEVAPVMVRKWRGNLEDSQQGLAQDIQIYPFPGEVRVGSKNEVLKFLEWGTSPHVIKPKDAEALRWFNDENEPVFAKKVRHPGIEPYGHMRGAIGQLRREFE